MNIITTSEIMTGALNSRVTSGDLEGATVREYFEKLLLTLWIEGEGFSGKRPFGNSGWEYDVIYPLIECGYILGEVIKDENGYIEDVDYNTRSANKKILELIRFMCKIEA